MDRASEARRLHRKIPVSRNRPVVGLTMGDPAGIGPEIFHQVIRLLGKKFRLHPIGFTQDVLPGKPSSLGARQVCWALEQSVRLLKTGEIQAVVNGPVSKEWLAKVG